MFQLNVPLEPKVVAEVAAIEARRNQEKERLNRIFNVRIRILGVDVAAQNSQVEEQNVRKAAERNTAAAYSTSQVKYDVVAQMIEKEDAVRQHRLSKKVQEFREQKQQLKTRQEQEANFWYSNQLWTQFPAYTGDCSPYYWPVNMQYYYGAYLRMQQEQYWYNLEMQRQEIQQAILAKQYIDNLNEQLRLSMETRAAQLAKQQESLYIAIMSAVANAKKAKAAELAEQKSREYQHKQKANLMKIQNQTTSDILTENPEVTQHPVNPHRVIACCWKSMTPQQQAAIRRAQEMQCHEKEAEHQAKQASDAAWGSQTMRLAQEAMERLCIEFQRGLGSFTQQLDKAQKAQENYLNSMYTNQPTDSYHLQFNSSCC